MVYRFRHDDTSESIHLEVVYLSSAMDYRTFLVDAACIILVCLLLSAKHADYRAPYN